MTPIKRTISAMSGDGVVVVAHNRRTYLAENVDPTRTHLNIEYCYTPIEEAYHQLFDAALAEFNVKQKRKDRCIDNYYEKIRDGKQEKTFYEVIFQVGNKDDMGAAGENAELAKTILDMFYRISGEDFYNSYIKTASFMLFPPAMHQSENYLQKGDGSFRDSSLVAPVLFLFLQSIGLEVHNHYSPIRPSDISVYYAGNYEHLRPKYSQVRNIATLLRWTPKLYSGFSLKPTI